MLRKFFYPKIDPFLTRIALFLDHKGISPNQLTLAGLSLCFVTGWVYTTGHVFLGGCFLFVASWGDLLDGPLARVTGKVTPFGAFLDSTLDRYSDFFVFGGLAVGFARQGREDLFLITLGILAGASVTSYAKARAENFIADCSVGLLGREERLLLLGTGSILWPLLPAALWILFFGTNATAIARILYAKKNLSGQKPPT